ncbi:skin secretory protein xP2-like isoform X2 [Prinia subflava]|uniref:skin secretory protein xP2-like isoform X2 n=1 Tax=Prinia subflava TaxID=208062 RepID=UPI002FE1F8F6
MMTRLSPGFVQPSAARGESRIHRECHLWNLTRICLHTREFLGSNCGVFLPSQAPAEVPAPLGISVRRGAAEPSRALQGPTARPGVGHSAWSAQKASTAPLPPPTSQTVLKVLEHKLLSCALLGTSACQGPPSARSIRVPRAPLAPGLVPPVRLTASPAQQGCTAQPQGYPSHLDFVTQVITVPREPSAQPPSSTGWNPPALPCLAMTSAPWATSAPVAAGSPCRAPLAPCPAPWGWGQSSSASPARLAGSAGAQGWLSWPRPRCVTQAMFAWKETPLPALRMGSTGTDVPAAPTARRARGWSCPVSPAPSAPCPGPAPACPACLARPAAALAPCSPSPAPEGTSVRAALLSLCPVPRAR